MADDRPPKKPRIEDGKTHYQDAGRTLGESGTMILVLYTLGWSPILGRLAGWMFGVHRWLFRRCEICSTTNKLTKSAVTRRLTHYLEDGAPCEHKASYACWACADCIREGCLDGSGV